MVYNLTFYTPGGAETRPLTVPELKMRAKRGDRRAIKELVELKGGWSALTAAQKTKVTRLMIMEDVDL